MPLSTKFTNKVNRYQVKVNLDGKEVQVLSELGLESGFGLYFPTLLNTPTSNLSTSWGYWDTPAVERAPHCRMHLWTATRVGRCFISATTR